MRGIFPGGDKPLITRTRSHACCARGALWFSLLIACAACSDSDEPESGNEAATKSPDGGETDHATNSHPNGAAGADRSTDKPGANLRALPAPDQRGPYEVAKDENVGEGFENPATNPNDQGDGLGCLSFISMFGGEEATNVSYSTITPDYDIERYTLYRPGDAKPGETFPVLSWANGTCAKVPGYDGLLSHLASHGFIVIAANSRYTGSGEAQLKAVDWVLEQNDNPDSPLHGHVATDLIGVFGHSQGGASTWNASKDPRIKTAIVLNAGAMDARPIPSYFLTGDDDVAFALNGSRSGAMLQDASAFVQLHEGSNHITLMVEPARVYPSVTAWFRYHLLKDQVGRNWFVGDDCKLCNRAEQWEYIAKDLP